MLSFGFTVNFTWKQWIEKKYSVILHHRKFRGRTGQRKEATVGMRKSWIRTKDVKQKQNDRWTWGKVRLCAFPKSNPQLVHYCTIYLQSLNESLAIWYMAVISALRRIRQDSCEFEANLKDKMRLCLKTKPNKTLKSI